MEAAITQLPQQVMASQPVLAFDIGGATSMAALVQDGRCIERRRVLTRRGSSPGAWLDAASLTATAWRGRFRHAVVVQHDDAVELASGLAHRLGLPVTSLPEALAAAWGEHRFGRAPGGELVFISAGRTISGAVVSGGALLRGAHGMAAQFGRLRVDGRASVDEVAGGAALLRRAASHGVRDLAGLLTAASAGSRWAVILVDEAAEGLASAITAIQAMLDPPVIVLGGAIGVASGFLQRLEGRLAETSPRPTLRVASIGAEGRLLGAADHAAAQARVLAISAQ